MKPSKLLQEVRKMRFEDIYQQRTEKRLSVEDAAKILGVTDRTVRRWTSRYEEEGAQGLADRRIDKAAHNAAPVDEVTEMLILFETRYRDFSVAHFYDKYRDEHYGQRSYTWVKNHLHTNGLVTKSKKRGQHRRKRPRQPMKGMMLHQDGSTHEWVDDHWWDLIVTMDDADSEIYSAFFVEEEGTWSSLMGVREVIIEHGLFCSLYVDRGSHYWYTPKEGGKVDRTKPTHFNRALKKLGIDLIPAYSPQARGRSERMFGTLQGRLTKEMKLEKIKTMAEANSYLKDFIPAFNKLFQQPAQEEQTAFISWDRELEALNDILCIEEERTVNYDNTLSYHNVELQLPRDAVRCSYAKTRVKVHEYLDKSLGVFHGPRCLAHYTSSGKLLK